MNHRRREDVPAVVLQMEENMRYYISDLHFYHANMNSMMDKRGFDSVEANDNKRKIILSHYPIFCYDGQYRLDEQGNPKVYMLYGHVHDTYDEMLVNHFQNLTRQQKRLVYHAQEELNIPCNMINCFCMYSDYTPLTLDEWIELDKNRRKNIPDPEHYSDTWMDISEEMKKYSTGEES